MYNQNLVYKWFSVQRMCPSCATTLSNSEVNEGYKDRQDPAITIKFPLLPSDAQKKWLNQEAVIMWDGSALFVKTNIIDNQGRILQLLVKKFDKYVSPGGKVEIGETPEDAIKRELKEELWVEVIEAKKIGWYKNIFNNTLWSWYRYETKIQWTPKNLEPDYHPQMVWVEIIDSDNRLWFALKIDETIIDDVHDIIRNFSDIYEYKIHISEKIYQSENDIEKTKINVLAWTTTPWTLPSNMFLAIGKHIRYMLVFDLSAKEYYVLAENLIKQYYKDSNEYLLINIITWEELIDLHYKPLFQYINDSKIDQKYKEQFFKIIPWEFVSTEDGTGIVHIAPAFGVDDYNIVAEFLPRDDSKNRLFLPVNDYGEFTDEVPERKGIRVYDANKDIIQRLKEENTLIGQRSYEHSYPHCRRCDTALISKALTSRFIKEQELTKITVPHADEIWFIPENIKKRFVDVLKSAPDRNLARNRYRWSPIPIRENQDDLEDKIVIGTLEELYQQSRTWSKNLTKLMFIRHGKTNYNFHHLEDSRGSAVLNEEWRQQVKDLVNELENKLPNRDDVVFIISPLQRDFLTIQPYFEKMFGKVEEKKIQEKYYDIVEIYQNLFDEKKLYEYIMTSGEKNRFKIWENIYIDFRTMELFLPDYQDAKFDCDKIVRSDKKYWANGESTKELFKRTEAYLLEVTKAFATQTIVTVAHAESIITMMKRIREFDFDIKRIEFHLHNAENRIFYRDNDRETEVDLHKPYVDNYRFTKDGHIYKRIPEVMDCRFESWSMPFGQCGYTGNQSKKPFVYPADFIMEGLDQTRGRFRGMHVCGNAIMKKNSYNNVIINGMVLAEDGKKMSKKLKNYPDPEYLFAKYGTDAYRLYLLSSPGVRAEAVRFSEKWVDQVYKDFTASILNAYKFFETYAKVDKRSTDNTDIYFMRHSDAISKARDGWLTEEGFATMKDDSFIEKILRVDPDIIYTSPSLRTMQTAEEVAKILKLYRNKKIEIKLDERLRVEEKTNIKGLYDELLEKEKWATVLIISHDINFRNLWPLLYTTEASLHKSEIIKLPTYSIDNELDKRILSELHNLGIQVEQEMNKYFLDTSAKLVLGFIEKLNNRFIRRSRRRFRASGMDQDKKSAFNTLFEVLQSYMKICAPFAPFISEHIYLELQKFTSQGKVEGNSIHLKHLPLYSENYIDKQLLEEIEVVRRIISLGLFIRSKNKIAVKQPLANMQIRM